MTVKFKSIIDWNDVSETLLEKALAANMALKDKTSPGNDFLGWLNLPEKFDKGLLKDMEETSELIRGNCQVFVIIGIGGSYLGARAVIDALRNETSPEILYAGHHLGSRYLEELLEYLKDKEVFLNVISKSGTTLEPALAFRFMEEFMKKKYGKSRWKRIIITTDRSKGSLKKAAEINKAKTFVIPDDIGGRFSVLTPVGLLPISVSGLNIKKLIEGAGKALHKCEKKEVENNISLQYAICRNHFMNKGRNIEILSSFEPELHYLGEWWKQLYGESEGKEGKGIFPATCQFTTDLHSMGQYIQDGQRMLFETFLVVRKSKYKLRIRKNKKNLDSLNYLSEKTLDYINMKAFEGTLKAHLEGNVPCNVIEIDELNEHEIGELLYYFMRSCGISAQLLRLNPFNQPGVEAYKKNIYMLLKK
ncbi:MAG: glucose-6-phosphate isomerase [Candidatus Coatesbacteria bacterium]|nr:glucose-6-phosphate isomerase [Candidatus Coatesbacteria bacterium]